MKNVFIIPVQIKVENIDECRRHCARITDGYTREYHIHGVPHRRLTQHDDIYDIRQLYTNLE
jgi:hypothetical protein